MAHSIVTHNGKDVLFVNHRGLSGDDLFNSYKAVILFLLDQKKGYLAVSDFSDSTGSKELNDYIQSEETKTASKYLTKLGVVGMTGVKKMVLRIYSALTGVNTKMFDTVEEALDYVTKD
jgi:hypothetical protein